MSAPRCVVIGTGRIAGGFVAPLLRQAGWEVDLVGRNRAVCSAIKEGGGLWLRFGDSLERRWIGGFDAICLDDPALPGRIETAQLLATAVGPSELFAVGGMLAPVLHERLSASAAPCNIITFENHRRAPLLLASGLIASRPALARNIGRQYGIGGAAVWRAVSRREIASDGLELTGDAVDECYADGGSLVRDAAPLDGSIPGLPLVRSFDDRMVEKLWLFNAGHAAAAFLGWHAGHATVADAMGDARIHDTARSVVTEAQQAFHMHLSSRASSTPLPVRPIDSILHRYADRALGDPVIRVAREPRRKLAAGDRLVGPSVTCLDGGVSPVALARAAAAALAYAELTDPQATDLQRELQLLGPEEVFAVVSALDPRDDLTRLVAECYREDHTLARVPS